MLVEIIDGIDYIYYTYDANNQLISMNYQDVEYFYVYDLQGNVTELIDITGQIVVRYRYDAWGNIVYQWSSTSNVDEINPYRYRGYRYDEESNLYYLQSRYYDPEIGRFISMDDVSFISTDDDVTINLYAYALNNPIMLIEPSGNLSEFWQNFIAITGVTVVVAMIIVASGLSTAIENGTNIAGGVLSGALKGFGTGVAIGLGIMTGGGASSIFGGLAAFGGALGVNFATGIGSYAIYNESNGLKFTWDEAYKTGYKHMASAAFAFAAGGLIGAAGFYNIPGETGSIGKTAAGLLIKGIYYYPIDKIIQMI